MTFEAMAVFWSDKLYVENEPNLNVFVHRARLIDSGQIQVGDGTTKVK